MMFHTSHPARLLRFALAASVLLVGGWASAKPSVRATPPKGKPALSNTQQTQPTLIPLDEGWTAHGGDWSLQRKRAAVEPSNGVHLVSNRPAPADFDVSVSVRIPASEGQAGLIFRVSNAAEGTNAFNGYYLGVDAAAKQAVFGRMARTEPEWTALVMRKMPFTPGEWYRIRVVARGSRIQGFVHRHGQPTAQPVWPLFDVFDDTRAGGGLGIRALHTSAEFDNMTLRAPDPLPDGPTYSNAGGLIPDLADPHVLKVNGEYYAYGTGGEGIRVYRSKDLVHWSDAVGATEGYALHPKDSWGEKWWWAPEVYQKGDGFLMYYSVQERLAFAESKSPLGPFVQDPKKIVHPDLYEIDSHLFVDDDGTPYIYYVPRNHGNVIAVAELEDDWITMKEDTVREILRQSQPWETDPVNEGPFVLKHKGVYYLMYSGNGFMNPLYGVGYATATHPLGPWTKYAHNPILQSNAYVHGVGHHAVTTSPDGKEMFAVYHSHKSPEDRWPRHMAIDRLRFAPNPEGGPDIMEAYGPTLTPQPMPSGSR